MELLIIGGTRFLGRALSALALERGHALTLFHRGQTAPELFPMARHILGDRRSELARLEGSWQAVIDTCGYVPRQVRKSARWLRGRCASYCFISSISVYRDQDRPGLAEDAPVATWEEAWEVDELALERYGALKAACEQAVTEAWGDQGLLIRPGLIVGPHDPTDRFTWWPRRFARGGRVPVPEPRTAPLQWIDVRDLAAFILDRVESGQGGSFNATGPLEPCSAERFLAGCADGAGAAAPVWVPRSFLAAHDVQLWRDLPVFAPDEAAGLGAVDIGRAAAAGLKTRPLAETVRATLDWDRARGLPALRGGLEAAREEELLALWAG